ncbi:hypothetical protein [Xylophilus sp. GOD-11R]|uniref:hypothetical protein n=1 Tax=Xylophilus sp. GOD-11R TaxID=3089814 RepID=UPI00298D01B1|nr:hypothetical protein [Xylophilus sp. GOD-11R]WPB58640.1 hypothetical protein R9X41_08390 [Xylophilus sp. GOD-11R]
MSSAASWSFTRTATLWPKLTRDDWTGQVTFGPPQIFACDYSAESKRVTDPAGVEFIARQIIYTEMSTAKQGDMVLIGESYLLSPIVAGALEIRAITRDSDTFEQAADDFTLFT